MKLETSKLLTRLSEQERNKVETQLAELNGRKHLLEQQYLNSEEHFKQLNQQRDQAMRKRHSASLLQAFDTAFREQQNTLTSIKAGIRAMEVEKKDIFERLAKAQRTHYTYDSMHQKEVKKQNRKDDLKAQRQMDDMVASRSSSSSV